MSTSIFLIVLMILAFVSVWIIIGLMISRVSGARFSVKKPHKEVIQSKVLQKMKDHNLKEALALLKVGLNKYNLLIHTDEFKQNVPHLPSKSFNLETVEKVVREKQKLAIVVNEEIVPGEIQEEQYDNSTSSSIEFEQSIGVESTDLIGEMSGEMVRIVTLLLLELPVILSNQEIAERLSISPMKISRCLNKLEKMGIIIREDNLLDARVKGNRLLEKGVNVLFDLYRLLNYYFY
ncbi:MAG: winged helix-turn-helix domain-containing protein [Candidatus Kariarchaeaceae archaeon]